MTRMSTIFLFFRLKDINRYQIWPSNANFCGAGGGNINFLFALENLQAPIKASDEALLALLFRLHINLGRIGLGQDFYIDKLVDHFAGADEAEVFSCDSFYMQIAPG